MKRIVINGEVTDYSATIDGRIYSWKRNIFMKPNYNKHGYQWIRVRMSNNKKICKGVHRLVAETFYGESNLEVNHIDGNKNNNSLTNLEFCTKLQNLEHARLNGLKKLKLTKFEIDDIRNSIDTGVNLSLKYNVSTALISLIKNNKIHG